MTKFIKTKVKKSVDQKNIDKYRGAANALQNIILISKLIFLRIIIASQIMLDNIANKSDYC